jgi:pimeloyl-ACP methyl ester carboxylesterase
MPFADIRGKRIYYETHGSGDTLVLLHHGFAGSYMWKELCPRFVEAGYRVVMYDRTGYGQSPPGPDFEKFYLSQDFRDETLEDFAAVTTMLGLESFHIVGQCEGGVLGVDYAGSFPGRVLSLSVASTLCFSTMTMTEFNKAKFPKSFEELGAEIREKLLSWHGAEHAQLLYEMARTHGGAYGLGKFDLRPCLPMVSCPTLVLYPDRSALFDVEQAVAFYRLLPKGELAVIPRCGHNTYDQRPDEYFEQVLRFLGRVQAEPNIRKEAYSMTCIAPTPVASRS